MRKRIGRIRPRSMAVSIIGGNVLLLLIFGLVVSTLGVVSFSRVFRNGYAVSTYHMADAAATQVNGDHLDDYLNGDEAEEYRETRDALDDYCKTMNVSLVYVIQVDTSDYGRFVSIFNLVNNAVDNSEYTPWELGYMQDTTNDEYRQKYEALYKQEAPYETVYRTKTPEGVHPHITTMVPVMDSAGDVAALLCIQRPIREIRDALNPYVRNIAIITILLGVLSSALAAVNLRKHFVDPIRRVSGEASRFARENTKGEPLGVISGIEEVADLAASIDTMESDMVSYMESLTSLTAKTERISTELSLATRIQESMLPNVFPPFPDKPEIDIYAMMDPAREVGGDFYDFFPVDDDHLCLIMADVAGKGVPAALFMMASKIILTDFAKMGKSPAQILTDTNAAICDRNHEEMFVTVWLGILEVSTGRLTAANAGHEYPVLLREGGRFELVKDRHGFVIGGMDGMRYQEYELQLTPGSKLFLYTDGVPEATDAAGGMFGTERMLAALNTAAGGSPKKILTNVRQAVDGFVKDAMQFDDLTMMCLEYKGRENDAEV